MFLSCSPFVVITTLSTGLVGVEVTVENKGILILTKTNLINTCYYMFGKRIKAEESLS